MSHTLKLSLTTFIAFFAIAMSMLFYVQSVHANPSFLAVSTGTSASTTAVQYMTAGTATTTETFNTMSQSTNALDTAVLLISVKSSTTVSTLFGTTTVSLRIEQSNDGVNYSLATSSTLQTGTCEQRGSSCTASTSVATFVIPSIPTSLQYVRAVVGVQPGSSNNGGVWMQFVGKRESK